MADKTVLVCDFCKDLTFATNRFDISGTHVSRTLDLCAEHTASFMAFIGTKAPRKRKTTPKPKGDGPKKRTKGGHYPCYECDRVFKYEGALRTHLAKKHGVGGGEPPVEQPEVEASAPDIAAA